MKIHIGSPALPWHLKAKLPSVYSRGVEYAAHQQGGVRRIFGVSFGLSRFYGFIVAGAFVHTETRISNEPEATSPSLSEAQEQAQAALDKVMRQRFSNFDAGAVTHWAERGLYQVKPSPSPQPRAAVSEGKP